MQWLEYKMVLVSVSIKICIWQKDRTQLNQFSRYTLYTYNIFTSLRLSSLYTSCPRTIQSWTAPTWRCLEERNGSISRRSGAPAYRAMFRQLATKLSLYPWKSQKSTYLQTIRPPPRPLQLEGKIRLLRRLRPMIKGI